MKNKNYISGTFAFKTDLGRTRLSNEDAGAIRVNSEGQVMMVVCDGMGGQNKGEFASNITVNHFCEEFESVTRFKNLSQIRRWIIKTGKKANSIVYREGKTNPMYYGTGTTLTVCVISQNGIIVGQVGDSRCYVLRNRLLTQITEDQTYVSYLYRTGKITKEEMKTHPKRHMLMNALGIYPSFDIDIQKYTLPKDSILLCSDGLSNNVSYNEMDAILNNEDSTEQKVNELIALANANGGSDNIAICLWEDQK